MYTYIYIFMWYWSADIIFQSFTCIIYTWVGLGLSENQVLQVFQWFIILPLNGSMFQISSSVIKHGNWQVPNQDLGIWMHKSFKRVGNFPANHVQLPECMKRHSKDLPSICHYMSDLFKYINHIIRFIHVQNPYDCQNLWTSWVLIPLMNSYPTDPWFMAVHPRPQQVESSDWFGRARSAGSWTLVAPHWKTRSHSQGIVPHVATAWESYVWWFPKS